MVHTPRHNPAPPELIRNQKKWTERYRGICTGSRQGDWATARAREVLRPAECVYCERILDLKRELAIDHYVAKKVDDQRCFDWDNLLPSCHTCNGAKGEEKPRRPGAESR